MTARRPQGADADPPAGLDPAWWSARTAATSSSRPREGTRVLCHPRGKKSELVVGDRVRWQVTGDDGVVDGFEPRRNLLFRQDDWRTKSFAANLDQLLMLVAAEPVFSESQLARALVAAQDAGIPALIGLNKTDLPAVGGARERLAPYRAMGVEVIEMALKADPAAARERLLAAPGRAARRWCWAPAAWARARSSTCWCRPPPPRWARSPGHWPQVGTPPPPAPGTGWTKAGAAP